MTMLFGFGCECCNQEICTFSIRLTIYSCFDNDNFLPNGPSAGAFNPVATGTMTYNGVEYPIHAITATGLSLVWNSPTLDKIDDDEEVTIELDPSWYSYPPTGDKDDPVCEYPPVSYEYDPLAFVPDCGINQKEIIGRETGRRVYVGITPCPQLVNLDVPQEQMIGFQRGLEGATVRIITPVSTHEFTLERYYHYLRCLNESSSPVSTSYGSRDYSFGYVEPADPMIITFEFEPPPGIPGYRSVSYDQVLFRSFPGDTCGLRWYATNMGFFPICPGSVGNAPDTHILKSGYVCGYDGYPHSRTMHYDDGTYSGILTCPNSCQGDVWEGVVSGFCSDARTILIRPAPQVPCCLLTGGTMHAFIRFGTGSIIGAPTPPTPPDFNGYNYRLYQISKSIPYCTFKCEGGGGFNDTPLADVQPSQAGGGVTASGAVWLPLAQDYEMIDVTIPLTHPIGGTFPCLYATASVIEVLP